MKQLPKYAFLTHTVGFSGMKVIMLEPPYIIANLYEVNKNQHELISAFMDDMVQGRFPLAKVKGYTVFLKMFTSLEPCNDQEYQSEILKEMAEFVLTDRIEQKPGQFMRYQDSNENQERIERTGRIMRERRPRIKKD